MFNYNEYSPIQYYQSTTMGELHRCRLCVAVYHELHSQCQVDNGWVPLDQNPHYFDNCQYNIKDITQDAV